MCAGGSRCNLAMFVWAQTNKFTVLTLAISCAVSRFLRQVASGPHPAKEVGVKLCPELSTNVPIPVLQFFIP